MRKRILELCNLDGVSGREHAIRDYILTALEASPTEKEVVVDALGNVVCKVKGKKTPLKKVMFAAHMDEVGVIVTHISDDGYLKFATVGGIDAAALYGKRVRFSNHKGVVGCKAVHLCSTDETNVLPKAEEMYIDIGAFSRDEAEKIVKPGDFAVFDADFTDMQDCVTGKALDDRVGCALLLELAEKTPPFDIILAFTVQEEIGLRGAGPVAFAVQPDIAVVVECTTAADIAKADVQKQVCQLSGGAVVSFMDKSTLYDAFLYQNIRQLAEEKGIPTQTKSMVAGGNDAAAIQRSAGGVRVAAVSVPCRYIHSPFGVISWKDVESVRALLQLLKEELPK